MAEPMGASVAEIKVWILLADGQAFDRTEQKYMQIVASTKLF
jgi:hypothetical protein